MTYIEVLTPMHKAYAYVPLEMNVKFEGYAKRCGLTSRSELLKLLIKRELRLRRLPTALRIGAPGGSKRLPLAKR